MQAFRKMRIFMRKHQRITAKDIAEACNVSQATVSYVINQTPGKRVSEAKRREILLMAEEMNYFPNRSAKSMRNQSCTSIGLVCCRNYGNAGFSQSLEGIRVPLDEAGYTLTILSDSNDKDFTDILRAYYSNDIAGVIFIALDTQVIDTTQLEENEIPYVVISENGVRCRQFEPHKAFESVMCDCIQFCRDHNLSRIRYFTRSLRGRVLQNKYTPLKKAADQIYPECDFERIILDVKNGSDDELFIPMQEYFASHKFDIAITSNHRLGILMQNCILKRAFTVPQTPLHICLSSSPFLLTVYPKISSLKIPLQEMGLYAGKLILSLINETPLEERQFECRLIHGDTTMLP